MEWSEAAQAAIKKVPFFVRKKVRRRVETEAVALPRRRGRLELTEIRAADLRFTVNIGQNRYKQINAGNGKDLDGLGQCRLQRSQLRRLLPCLFGRLRRRLRPRSPPL